MKMFIGSRYYALPHRVAHHVFTGCFILVCGFLLSLYLPISEGGKWFLLCAAVSYAVSRFLRVPLVFMRNRDEHPQRVFAHSVEILVLLSLGAWLGQTLLDGELRLLFYGLVCMHISKHLFPLIDHTRSWRWPSKSNAIRRTAKHVTVQS